MAKRGAYWATTRMVLMGKVTLKELYIKFYKRIEELHGRTVTDLDAQRAWDRYSKKVGKNETTTIQPNS